MIVVLTLGRSGSSFLMQTLRTLGVPIVGRAFDQRHDPADAAEHHRLNPGGYFEDPDLYRHGTSSPRFSILAAHDDRPACKLDLRHLTDATQHPSWMHHESGIDLIILSVRHPAEQARSEYLATSPSDQRTSTHRFMATTSFLREYAETMIAVEDTLNEPLRSFRSRVRIIDYGLMSQPDGYVECVQSIVESAGHMPPDRAAMDHARDAIDPELYRIRSRDLVATEVQWSDLIGATAAYRRLIDLNVGKQQ